MGRLPRVPRWAKIALSLALLAVALWFVVIPQYRSAVDALGALERLSIPLVVVAALAELASLAVFSGMTSAALGSPRPSYATLLRVDLVDLGVNHVVPGGGTTSAAVRFGLLTRIGVRSPDAFSAAAVEITFANLLLGLVFGTGLVVTVASTVASSADDAALVTVGVFALLAVVSGWLLLRHGDDVARLVGRVALRVPLVSRASAENFVLTLSSRLRTLAHRPRRLVALVVLGLLNWLLDAAALGVVLAACGAHVSLGALLTVYGLGSILAMLPLTPGGLGIVEGVMVPALVATGVPADLALLGVIGWRLLEYWLPIPLALAAYVSLRSTVLRKPREGGTRAQRRARATPTPTRPVR